MDDTAVNCFIETSLLAARYPGLDSSYYLRLLHLGANLFAILGVVDQTLRFACLSVPHCRDIIVPDV